MSAKVSVRIRMYRQGLGDCFLLTFRSGDVRSHVLIDCGVVVGAPDGQSRVGQVAEHIRRDCQGHLNLLVATHEHWDHISGFVQAKRTFDTIEIDKIWMAWTEDPIDRQAIALRRQRSERITKLAAATERWAASLAVVPRADPLVAGRAVTAVDATRSILDFFGPDEALAAKGDKTREAMNYLRTHPTPKNYLEPGEILPIPKLTDVRAYVLGPPRDETRIKKDLPSSRTPETYSEPMRISQGHAFLAAAVPAATLRDGDDLYQPFEKFYRIPSEEAAGDPFFSSRYGFAKGSASDGPDRAPAWRRIDDDWLAMASELALQLDSDTNNTSLVLAFELGAEGDVLLFAADAQVGNWLSWRDVTFDRSGVKSDDLLKRTIFYKVGHHASHNATLREQGLEMMSSRRLAAFIPVDKATAEKVRWHKMPFDPLLDRLLEKCRRRVVRMDTGPDADAPAEFRRDLHEDPLYYDLEIQSSM